MNNFYKRKLPPVAKNIVDKYWLKDKGGKFVPVRSSGIFRVLEYDMQIAMFKCSLELIDLYWHSMSHETKIRAMWTKNNIKKQLGEMQ